MVSLLGYQDRVFAATADTIFDGASEAVTGLLGGSWSSGMISNPGGRWLVAVNGVDEARKYGGFTWSISEITGVNSRDLFALTVHQRRIFAAEKESLRVWYLGLDCIEGEASPIPLHAQCRLGGSVVALATLQPQGGISTGDELVIATSEGEIVVYTGTNPDKAGEWSLRGVWRIPKPVGANCFARMGGILTILTEKGVMPIPAVLSRPDSAKPVTSLSQSIDVITGAVSIIDSAAASFTLVDAGTVQYVRSDTGAWSRFTGFSTATCWMDSANALWFGRSDGKVCRYGGETDDGSPIRSFAVDSFSKFGVSNRKSFKRARPTYTLAHPYVPRIEMLTDYREPPSSFDAANLDARYWEWNEITWPSTPLPWYAGEVSSRLQPWRSIGGHGVAGALMMSIQTMTPVIWTGYDVGFEIGGQV